MTAYERLEWVIPEVQPEVWDIIMVFKKAAEERDRKIAEAKFEADRLEGFKTYNDIRQEKQLFKWKRMNMTDLTQTWEDEDRNLYLLARHMEDGPLSWGRFEESTNYYKPLLSGKGVEVYHHYDEMVISGRK